MIVKDSLLAACWCALLVVLCLSCDTETSVESPDRYYFVKYYGSDGNQEAVDMVVTDNGDLLVLGNSVFGGVPQIILLRIGAEGNVLWERSLLTGGTAVDLEPLENGDVVVLANEAGGCRLIRVTTGGEVKGQSEIITDGGKVIGYSVTVLANGGYIVSGTSDNTGSASDAANLVNFKLNADYTYDPIWSPVNQGFGAAPGQSGRVDVSVKAFQRIIENAGERDTIYHIFGYTDSNIGGNNPDENFGFFYFKRDKLGGTADVVFPGNLQGTWTEIQYAGEVSKALGGGYLVLGTAHRGQESYLFVARLRQQLEYGPGDITLQTHIPLGRPVHAVSAATSVAGGEGFLLLANEVRATGATNIWLSKIDQSGAVRWSATYGSENEDDKAAAVTELPDGRIVILGTVRLADNQTKIALIKTNTRGQFLR